MMPKSTVFSGTERNSAVELLRIFSMLMIVLSHICCHSGFDYTYSLLTVNRLFVQFGILGNLGVGIFLLISGYFLCGKPLKSLSVSRLLAQVWFYSVTLYFLCKFAFGTNVPEDALLIAFFPTIYEQYWFFTAYFIILLLSPFLNILLHALSQLQFKIMLILLSIFWILIPTLTKQQMYSSELVELLLYFFFGAYFRLHPDHCPKKPLRSLALGFGALLALYALTIILGYCERFTPNAFGVADRFYRRNSLFIILSALGLFSAAVSFPPFTNRIINQISSCTFGVYLIHDHPAVREVLWKHLLNHGNYFTSGSFIPRLIGSVILVYAMCTLIEFFRLKILAEPMSQIIDKVLSRLLAPIVQATRKK